MDFFSFKYKNRDDAYEDPRRDFLVKALTLGLLVGGGLGGAGRAQAMGDRPKQLPPGRSIYRLRGDVRINGVAADKNQVMRPDDDIETGSDGEAIFVVGQDAFIMRENGRLELSSDPVALASASLAAYCNDGESPLLSGLRLISGKLLSVFGTRSSQERLGMRTPTATVGIRGTGVYMESEPGRSYICTCYGQTRLATADEAASERITATHHDSPRYIMAEGSSGKRIEPAPLINHTDMELLLIEELVGRTPPFAVSGSDYDAPRKITY